MYPVSLVNECLSLLDNVKYFPKYVYKCIVPPALNDKIVPLAAPQLLGIVRLYFLTLYKWRVY